MQEVIRDKTDTQFVQMNKIGNITRKIIIKAILVTDLKKRIFVETMASDTIRNLQVMIGIEMQSRFPDQFQSLDNVRAYNITKVNNKELELKETDLVSDYLEDED